jgi:hypothetical protein
MAWLYLATKPSHVGSMGLGKPSSCAVLRPIAITRGDMASCQLLSCPITALGGGTSLGDVKPPGLDTRWSVDHMGTCATICQCHHGI